MKQARDTKTKRDNCPIDNMIPAPNHWISWGTFLIILLMAFLSIACFYLPCAKTVTGEIVTASINQETAELLCQIIVSPEKCQEIHAGQQVDIRLKNEYISMNTTGRVILVYKGDKECRITASCKLQEKQIKSLPQKGKVSIIVEHFILGRNVLESFLKLWEESSA